MELKMAYVLKNWQLIKHLGNDDIPWYSVTGNVYGRSGWQEGKKLFSSEIKSVEMVEGIVCIQTRNSTYHCAENDHAYSGKDADALKELLGENEMRQIMDMAQEKEANRRRFLLSKIPMESNKALMFVMSDSESFYFESALIVKDGGTEIVTDYHVHVGMIQDSVLIGDMDHFDFRFFPYKGNRLKFYAWAETYEPVYVYNEGIQPIEVDCPYGDFLVEPGTMELLDKSNTGAMISEHIAPGIDKYTVWDTEIDENGNVSYH